MNQTRVRAIIPYKGGIILIHRIRETETGEKKDYYVFPGGGKEEQDRTLESCVEREVHEELGIIVRAKNELYRLVKGNAEEHFYLCEYQSGVIGTGKGPEFGRQDYKGRGIYLPEIVPREQIRHIDLLQEVRDALVHDIQHFGFFDDIEFRELR